MKEQIKAPEKIQLSNEEKANLSDAWFKTLLIRMLTDGWVWSQKRGKSEGYEKSNKEQCTGKETGTPMNGLDQKEEINIQPEQNEETRIQTKQNNNNNNNKKQTREAWEPQGQL